MTNMKKSSKIMCKVGTIATLVACFAWGYVSTYFKDN